MVHRQSPVHPGLQPYIRSYYLIERFSAMHVPQMVPASSKCALNIPYGDPLQIQLKGNTYTTQSPFLLGLATQSYQINVLGKALRCFVVEFSDLGFYVLFREQVQPFVDTLIEAEAVGASRNIRQLQAQLAEAESLTDKVNCVERFLLQLVPDQRVLDRIGRVEAALQRIRQCQGLISVQGLADEVCLSERQFRRMFTEVKGCSPKHFTGLIRFTSLFTEVMQQPGKLNGAYLAYKYQYHDQMHFIKDFKQYTLHTPTRLPVQQFRFSTALTVPGIPESLEEFSEK